MGSVMFLRCRWRGDLAPSPWRQQSEFRRFTVAASPYMTRRDRTSARVRSRRRNRGKLHPQVRTDYWLIWARYMRAEWAV